MRKTHDWDDTGERCLKCGDKDWFASKECEGKHIRTTDKPLSETPDTDGDEGLASEIAQIVPSNNQIIGKRVAKIILSIIRANDNKDGWISVETCQPRNIQVLTYGKEIGYRLMIGGSQTKLPCDVTHWRNLPSPPNEVAE